MYRGADKHHRLRIEMDTPDTSNYSNVLSSAIRRGLSHVSTYRSEIEPMKRLAKAHRDNQLTQTHHLIYILKHRLTHMIHWNLFESVCTLKLV